MKALTDVSTQVNTYANETNKQDNNNKIALVYWKMVLDNISLDHNVIPAC